ncbi:hypothetical protein HUG20_01945 [Salicibibacter cibi]|uniref:Uncharacterized protein n=1 Tax=Salicibibacter cibi TaxID=2743001 RepID=A0A7T6Z8I2_9BACI|nr:hypothetical protein [Salicibibacter cibi]QQK78786.1 hypothetical protein HUG20_01945 [Salicibibacter cibi]
MVNISYKEFIDETRLRLDDFSKEDLQTLILQWASDERPSNREAFLTKLTVEKEGKTSVSYADDALIEDIETFAERVDTGEYVDGFGWDPEIMDEREFGDESWAEEMDDFFLEAREFLRQSNYEVAEEAYKKLFEVLEMGEEGSLPGDFHPENMLDVDVSEHRALYFRSVYMNAEAEERVHRMYDAMVDDTYLESGTKIKDVRDSLDAPLPDFQSFLSEWTELLMENPPSYVSELLREAVFLKGGISAISEFAKGHAKQFPKAYVDWIEALEKEGDQASVLQAATEGLSKIPSDYIVRAEVAQKLAKIGNERDDDKLRLKGFRESFYSNPSMDYLLNLYLTAHKEGCFEEITDEAEKRMIELENKEHRDFTFYNIERRSSTFRESVFIHVQLLAGKFEKVFQMCEGWDSLGWTFGSNPKPVMLIFLMDVLSKRDERSNIINEQWRDTIGLRPYGEKESDMEKYMKLIDRVKETIDFTEEQEHFYLDWCKKETGNRIDAIVGNQKRGSYHKAAKLLVAMAETLANRGTLQDGNDFIATYRSKYPRHSSFKKELTSALQVSGL